MGEESMEIYYKIKRKISLWRCLHKPGKIRMKLNHIVFWWYYKRCGEHFRQYPFFKSVKVLISNYVHMRDSELPLERESQRIYAIEANKLRKELQQIKLNDAANAFREAGGDPDTFLKSMGYKNIGGKEN